VRHRITVTEPPKKLIKTMEIFVSYEQAEWCLLHWEKVADRPDEGKCKN
jgi:hypothetical protein